MIHLGDITKIKGNVAPTVDCVVGGSPCQDLSLAGKRAGLAGARSGLYMEQIRIIKEMREHDSANGRSGVDIRPRYMVWENVPGAFSTNKGQDFAAVLEEAIRVAEPEAPSVSVPEKGWPTAGCIVGEQWSVAWRVLDAQFWGTSDKPLPQQRRRIALVADFGGLSAQEILFVRKSVSGNLEPGKQKRKEAPRDACEGVGGAVPYTVKIRGGIEGGGKGALVQTDKRATLSTLQDQTLFQPIGFLRQLGGVDAQEDCSTTLLAAMGESGNNKPCVAYSIENHPAVRRVDIDDSGKVKTLTSRMGTGGGNVPMVMEPITLEPGIAAREGGHIYEGVSGTIRANAGDNQMAVAHTVCIEGNGSRPSHKDDGFSESDTMYTLNTVDRHAVCYNIGSYHSNAWKSDNPNSGVYEADKSKTLDALQCGYPGCNQGGMAVVQPMQTYQKVTGPLMANSHPGSYTGQDAFSDMLIAGYAAGGFGNYTEGVGTLRASGGDYGGGTETLVRCKHIVRRLTPLECERLQGFPDGWTDIGEWVDSKGKKHKEADSPRYKALGNSIALPPWKWVLKRLCACYERDATMASLFDGIGGFPLIWEQINGKGSCLWASEIEEFPIAVTKLRFGGNDNG